jgi:hypothetical protein
MQYNDFINCIEEGNEMRKHSKQGNQPAAESAYRRKRGNGIISVAIILMFALILQGCQLRTLETSTNDPISSTNSPSDHASTEDSTTSKTEDTSQSQDTTQSDSETISDTTSESESSTEQSDTTEDTSNTEQTNQPTTTKGRYKQQQNRHQPQLLRLPQPQLLRLPQPQLLRLPQPQLLQLPQPQLLQNHPAAASPIKITEPSSATIMAATPIMLSPIMEISLQSLSMSAAPPMA